MILGKRPLPEDVRRFVGDLDLAADLPGMLLENGMISDRPSSALANNVAALLAAYRRRDLLSAFLRVLPTDCPLSFRIQELDLSGSDWRGRYLQGVEFVSCSLDGADFTSAHISELGLIETSVSGARFNGARVDSVALDFSDRAFGQLEVMNALRSRGAETGEQEPEVRRSLAERRREEIVDIVKGRLRRFYVAGRSDTQDSRWDSSILERNLFGGVDPGQMKYVRSKVVPRMLSLNILGRQRAYGDHVYHLSNEAEDDARRLLEDEEVLGMVKGLVDRLAP